MARTSSGDTVRSSEHVRPLCLYGIEGLQDRRNDAVFMPSLPRTNEEPNYLQKTLVYFGGDIQNLSHVMDENDPNIQYQRWCLEMTAKKLAASFPFHHIVVIRPSRVVFEHVNCFDNFVPSNFVGTPKHAFYYRSLVHMKRILKMIGKKVSSMPSEDLFKMLLKVQEEEDGYLDDDSNDDMSWEFASMPEKRQSCLFRWQKNLRLSKYPLTMIAFSKGCIVLNQFLYEFHYAKRLEPYKQDSRFVDRIEAMYWLDGGHPGQRNVYLTSRAILKTLTDLGIELHVHVSPYQTEDFIRPWIRRQWKEFIKILKSYNAKLTVHRHDTGTTDLRSHFSVLANFMEKESSSLVYSIPSSPSPVPEFPPIPSYEAPAEATPRELAMMHKQLLGVSLINPNWTAYLGLQLVLRRPLGEIMERLAMQGSFSDDESITESEIQNASSSDEEDSEDSDNDPDSQGMVPASNVPSLPAQDPSSAAQSQPSAARGRVSTVQGQSTAARMRFFAAEARSAAAQSQPTAAQGRSSASQGQSFADQARTSTPGAQVLSAAAARNSFIAATRGPFTSEVQLGDDYVPGLFVWPVRGDSDNESSGSEDNSDSSAEPLETQNRYVSNSRPSPLRVTNTYSSNPRASTSQNHYSLYSNAQLTTSGADQTSLYSNPQPSTSGTQNSLYSNPQPSTSGTQRNLYSNPQPSTSGTQNRPNSKAHPNIDSETERRLLDSAFTVLMSKKNSIIHFDEDTETGVAFNSAMFYKLESPVIATPTEDGAASGFNIYMPINDIYVPLVLNRKRVRDSANAATPQNLDDQSRPITPANVANNAADRNDQAPRAQEVRNALAPNHLGRVVTQPSLQPVRAPQRANRRVASPASQSSSDDESTTSQDTRMEVDSDSLESDDMEVDAVPSSRRVLRSRRSGDDDRPASGPYNLRSSR